MQRHLVWRVECADDGHWVRCVEIWLLTAIGYGADVTRLGNRLCDVTLVQLSSVQMIDHSGILVENRDKLKTEQTNKQTMTIFANLRGRECPSICKNRVLHGMMYKV